MAAVPSSAPEVLSASAGSIGSLTRVPASQPVMMAAAPTLGSPGPQAQQWVAYPQAQRPVVLQVPGTAPVITTTSSPTRMRPNPDSPQAALITQQVPTMPMTTASFTVTPGMAPQMMATTVGPPTTTEVTTVQGGLVVAAPSAEVFGVAPTEVTTVQVGGIVGAAPSVEIFGTAPAEAQGGIILETLGPETERVVVGVQQPDVAGLQGQFVEVQLPDEPVKSQNSFVYSPGEQPGQEGRALELEELCSPGLPGQLDAGAAAGMMMMQGELLAEEMGQGQLPAEEMGQGELLTFEELQNFVGQLADTQQQHAEMLNGLPGLESLLLNRIDEQFQEGIGQNLEVLVGQRTDEVLQQVREQGAQALKEEIAAFVKEEMAAFEAAMMQHIERQGGTSLSAHEENLQAQIDQLRMELDSLPANARAEAPEFANLQAAPEFANLQAQVVEHRDTAMAHLEELRAQVAGLPAQGAQESPDFAKVQAQVAEHQDTVMAHLEELRAEMAGLPAQGAQAPHFTNLQAQVDEHRDTVMAHLEELRAEVAGLPAQGAQGAQAQDHAEILAHLDQLRGDVAHLAKEHRETLPAQLEELHVGLTHSKAAHRETSDALDRLQGGVEASIMARLESQLQELRAGPEDTLLRLKELSEKVEALGREVREDVAMKEMKDLGLGSKIPRIEQALEEQQVLVRELSSLNLPAATGRLEAAITELQAADLRPLFEQEVQGLKEQIEVLQAQIRDTGKDLASVAGLHRELDERLGQRQEKDVGAAELQAQLLSQRLEKLEQSHDQHASALELQHGGVRQLQVDLEALRDGPQSFNARLVDVHEQAQSLNDRQSQHKVEVLEKLQILETSLIDRMERVISKQAGSAYEPETEIQLRGLQEAVERLQDDHRQLYVYVGADQDSVSRGKSPKGAEDTAEIVEQRLTTALEAEVTRRCLLVADLHQRLAREVAGVSRHLELRWEELVARIDAESVARQDGITVLRKSMQTF